VTATAVTLTAMIGTLAVGGGVMLVLRVPLHAVLRELCVLEHRARFWERVCTIELLAGVGLAATMGAAGPVLHADEVVEPIAGVIRWELVGGIVGLLAIAAVVAREAALARRARPPLSAGVDGSPKASSVPPIGVVAEAHHQALTSRARRRKIP
jgi:hypothetical protein